MSKFKDLSPTQQGLVAAVTAVSLGLIGAAQLDLNRRSSEDLRGDKRLWRLLCLNALGVAAYFGWGRR
jgi:hypothetical protein